MVMVDTADATVPKQPLNRQRWWAMRHPKVGLMQPTCYGRLEVPVDMQSLHQCVAQLECWLPAGTRLLTSERERTRMVAQRLQQRRPDLVDMGPDARLNEMDFGIWEGVAWADIPRRAVDVWADDFALHRFGGVECAQDVVTRVAQARMHALCMLQDAPLLWITHAGVLRALAFLQKHPDGQLVDATQWPNDVIGFGAVQTMEKS